MSKQVYLLRHAHKDDNGILTPEGEKAALNLKNRLPKFIKVISSESKRSQTTAKLLTDKIPLTDSRAGFYMASQQKSDELNRLAKEKNISFLEAVLLYNDEEVLVGVSNQADQLNELIDELFESLQENENALIVSHDLSISPAMQKRGIRIEHIPFLSGYIIDGENRIMFFNSK